jgi:heme/copper-type cytochrome/quinol oxidase subunit 4
MIKTVAAKQRTDYTQIKQVTNCILLVFFLHANVQDICCVNIIIIIVIVVIIIIIIIITIILSIQPSGPLQSHSTA